MTNTTNQVDVSLQVSLIAYRLQCAGGTLGAAQAHVDKVLAKLALERPAQLEDAAELMEAVQRGTDRLWR